MTTPRGEDDGAKRKRQIINPGRGRNDRRILDLGDDSPQRRRGMQETGVRSQETEVSEE